MKRHTLDPGAWTYYSRFVRCTPRCAGCAGETGHGPYWYRQQRVKGKLITQYVGRNLPEGVTREVRQ